MSELKQNISELEFNFRTRDITTIKPHQNCTAVCMQDLLKVKCVILCHKIVKIRTTFKHVSRTLSLCHWFPNMKSSPKITLLVGCTNKQCTSMQCSDIPMQCLGYTFYLWLDLYMRGIRESVCKNYTLFLKIWPPYNMPNFSNNLCQWHCDTVIS